MPRTTVRRTATLALLLVLSSSAAASPGPTTPTFALAWGSLGTDPGQFTNPARVTTDALGNVYVADVVNHNVQKFDRLGRWLGRWGSSGTGNGQFNAPYGMAIDANGNVYVADIGNSRIQKFTASGVFLMKWGVYGSADGQFIQPAGVTLDAAGNVLVADLGNYRIQKFSPTGVFLTKWGSFGNADGQFFQAFGVATDAAGNVFVSDFGNHRIQKFSSTGVFQAKWGSFGVGDGEFDGPTDVATDAVGNIYVADGNGHRIQKFTASGTFLTKWGSTGSGTGQFGYITGLAVDAAVNVYVADLDNHRVQKFSGAGVATLQTPPAYLLKWGSSGTGNVEFSGPIGVAVGPAGEVYVADTNNHRIQKFTAAGAFVTAWDAGDKPMGVAAYGDFVYVVDYTGHSITMYSTVGDYITSWGDFGFGYGHFQFPSGVAVDAAGNLYVSDTFNNLIQKFDTYGGFQGQWGATGSGDGQFSNPFGVATDAAGNVYVMDTGNSRVQKFSGTGVYKTQWGSAGLGDGQFSSPWNIGTDVTGNVYVSDFGNSRIQKFSGSGVLLAKFGSSGTGNGQFFQPRGVTADAAGNVYVVDAGNTRVQKFTTVPEIALVSDIRNDQGRQARLRILRASADIAGSGVPVLRYDLYRRIDALPGVSSAQLAGWEQVGSISARGDAEYNAVLPTLVDATASSLEYSAFMASAVTADPTVYFDSPVENGFSVDNLAPPAPAPLTGTYAAGSTHLHWAASTAPDFATYRLYRGSGSMFVPSPANLLSATTDNVYDDPGPDGSSYKVSAVDRNGNESAFASFGPGQTTDVPIASAFAFALEGVRPNPARGGRMLVHFTLPSDAPARLDLFDLAGRRITARDVGALGAGRHAEDLAPRRALPAGVYLVRLTQGAEERTVRQVVLE